MEKFKLFKPRRIAADPVKKAREFEAIAEKANKRSKFRGDVGKELTEAKKWQD